MQGINQIPLISQGQLPAELSLQLISLECQESHWADLTTNEKARAAGYKIQRVRDQFVAGRSELRRALANIIPCAPCDIEIHSRPDGKPELADHSLGLHFNVSHSVNLGLIAIGKRPLGVDLEHYREVRNAGDLLKRFFTADEFSQYMQIPDQLKPNSFFRGWTCKEAVLKGDGRGMRVIDACRICMDPRLPPQLISFANGSSDWKIICWQPIDGYTAALAYQ